MKLRMILNAVPVPLFTLLQHVGHFFIDPIAVDTQAREGKWFALLTRSSAIRKYAIYSLFLHTP